jgi:hypothetical protein
MEENNALLKRILSLNNASSTWTELLLVCGSKGSVLLVLVLVLGKGSVLLADFV